MSDLRKDTGRILFVIRLFLFTLFLCAILFSRRVNKCLYPAEVDSTLIQSELMLGLNSGIPAYFVLKNFPAKDLNTQLAHFHQKVHLLSLQSFTGTLRNHCYARRDMTFLMQTDNDNVLILQT